VGHDLDLYTEGFQAGIDAAKQAADILARQLDDAAARADEAWKQVQDARADQAEMWLTVAVLQQQLANLIEGVSDAAEDAHLSGARGVGRHLESLLHAPAPESEGDDEE